MSFGKKIAIALDTSHPLWEVLSPLSSLDFMLQGEVHLVSVQRTTTYAVGLGEASIIYPLETEKKNITARVVAELERGAKKILPEKFQGKLKFECLFGDSPKRTFCDYVKDQGIDTIILAAREKRGLFEGSFSQYVSRHTKAHLVVLKG